MTNDLDALARLAREVVLAPHAASFAEHVAALTEATRRVLGFEHVLAVTYPKDSWKPSGSVVSWVASASITETSTRYLRSIGDKDWLDFATHYVRHDSATPTVYASPHQVFAYDDLIPSWGEDALTGEFFPRLDIASMLIAHVPITSQVSSSIGVGRASGAGAFSERDRALLQRALPVLVLGARVALLNEQLRASEELASSEVGTVLLSEDVELLHADAGARSLLAELARAGIVAGDFLAAGVASTAPPFPSERSHVLSIGGRHLRATFTRTGLPGSARVLCVLEALRPGTSDHFQVFAHRAGLTDREAVVAALAARGLTNGEIALELGLRPATVQQHLSSIFRKTRTDGRTELAARIHGAR